MKPKREASLVTGRLLNQMEIVIITPNIEEVYCVSVTKQNKSIFKDLE